MSLIMKVAKLGVLLKRMCLDIVRALFKIDRLCIGDLACFFVLKL